MAWNSQLAVNMPKKAFVGDFEPGFMIKLARKDVRLALQLVRQSGLEPRFGAAAFAALNDAIDAGMGDKDTAAMLLLQERKAGTTVRLAKS